MFQFELGLYITVGLLYLFIWLCNKKSAVISKATRLTRSKTFLIIMFTVVSMSGYLLYTLYTYVAEKIDALKLVGSLLNTFVLILSWYITEGIYSSVSSKDGVRLNEKEKIMCNLVAMLGVVFIILLNGIGEDVSYSMVCIVVAVFISTYWGISSVYKEQNIKETMHNLIGEFSGILKRYWVISIFSVLVFGMVTKYGGWLDRVITNYSGFMLGSLIGYWVLIISALVCVMLGGKTWKPIFVSISCKKY